MLGFAVAYGLGRILSADFVSQLTERYPKFRAMVRCQHSSTVFFCIIVRSITFLLSDIISLYLSASKCGFGKYMLGSTVGTVISLVIIKSGFEMLKNTVSQILGEHNDPDLAKSIKETVTGFEGVQGAYDLVLNNYGPDAWNGSVHIEVPDTYSADRIDRLIREIQMAVYSRHKVLLTAVQKEYPEHRLQIALDTDFSEA